MIHSYVFLAKGILTAFSALMLTTEPTTENYNLMSVYPEEVEQQSLAAQNTEQFLRPLTSFLRISLDLTSQYPSYGETFYKKLCSKDAEWSASIYQWFHSTPEDAAERIGLSRDQILGKFNPDNPQHDSQVAESWTIPAWGKINFHLYNGAGETIPMYSNATEILSMANTYTFYNGWDDTELFEKYINDLWENSHKIEVEIGPVYYCTGCTAITIPETPVELLTDSGSHDDSIEETAMVASDASQTQPLIASVSEATAVNDIDETFSTDDRENECFGHVDLTLTATIYGLTGDNTLYDIDQIGTTLTKRDDISVSQDGESWAGWVEGAREEALHLAEQNWEQKYGLVSYGAGLGTPLTSGEKNKYMSLLPTDLSSERRAVIKCALDSVGKIPYYFGGKTDMPGYASNDFGTPAREPDEKGRVLSGLDCSGWINWVYDTATGSPITAEGTQGLAREGTDISKEELLPGDLLIRLGAGADSDSCGHVVMFLFWNNDGTVTVIHETGKPENNVIVDTVSANWPYFKSYFSK